jgi:hypothetical protein
MFDSFMRSKMDFLAKNLVFGVHFGVHCLVCLPFIMKVVRVYLTTAFFFWILKTAMEKIFKL